MREGCHAYTTQRALGILREVTGKPDLYADPETRTPSWAVPGPLMASLAASGDGYHIVGFETANCDHQNDIELVDVDGVLGSASLDNPHKATALADDDEPHYEALGNNFTAFSHFIDLRKGPGLFDDYDGYSYGRGTASVDQHEDAASWSDLSVDDTLKGFATDLIQIASGKKVDEGMAFYFGDEYVHAPGHQWYRPGICSPALERYTHTAVYGPTPANVHDHRGGEYMRFETNEAECKERFPLSEGRVTLTDGLGYPYSVFCPVDNLALANWRAFEGTGDLGNLGRVMHGIQDASIPHHASGTIGNFHRRYEWTIEQHIVEWSGDPAVRAQIKTYLEYWDREDENPPTSIRVGQEQLIPANNWEIDQLVTWIALHAYSAFANVYHGFPNGFEFDEENAKGLVVLVLAMSAHVLRKAGRHQGIVPPRFQVPIKDPGLNDAPPVTTDVSDGGAGQPTGPELTPIDVPVGPPPAVRHGGGGVTVTESPTVRDHRATAGSDRDHRDIKD